MKKRHSFCFILITFLTVCLSGCAESPPNDTPANAAPSEIRDIATTDESKEETNVPQIDKVRAICELATLECRYHNIAKSKKEAGKGLLHIGEKERTFWIEYTGIAEISFNIEDLEMKQNGTEIVIKLPEPQISCKVDSDSWTEDSYIVSNDQWIQKNPITAEDQTQAINDAQISMENSIRNNSSLLNTAREQAKELIENYINQIGNATDITYSIRWDV